MVNEGSLRQNGDQKSYAGLKGSLVVALCALLIVQTAAATAQEPVQNAKASSTATAEMSSSQPVEELPSAPVPQSSTQPQQTQPAQQPASQPQQPASQPQQQNQQQPGPPQDGQAPVGTAAAPYEKPTGIPGSRPAGAAIAPAKQRRVRAIVISLAVVLAGAGAIGAVAGMSKASHSQP